MAVRISTFVLLLQISLIACAATEEAVDAAGARAAVIDAWQQGQHTVWAIEWAAMPSGGPVTVETWRVNNRYRFEILEAGAPAMIGETLIFDGQRAWQYNHFTVTSPKTVATPWLSPISDVLVIVEQLLAQTPQAVSRTPVGISSGPAQKLRFQFAEEKILTVWLDDQMGLPVRLHLKTDRGEITMTARSYEPLIAPPAGLFEPTN